MATTRIVELSQRIAANTAKVNAFFVTNNIPEPSFGLDAPLHSSIPQSETEILDARRRVINDTQELRELMLGPREHLSSYDENSLVSIQAVTRFRLAHAFPVGSETTLAELAAQVGLGETHIRKLVRYAITQKIFCEPSPGVIAHSACSRLIVEDETTYSYLRFKVDNFWHAAYHLCDAVARWPGSEEPNQTGISECVSTCSRILAKLLKVASLEIDGSHQGLNYMDSLWLMGLISRLSNISPIIQRRPSFFYNAMRAFAQRPGLEPKYIVENYPWSSLPHGATVVDVGGSHGLLAIELARAFPTLNLVVQDLDEPIIADAAAQKPEDVADRVRFMVHDFLEPQPISAAVYYFRHIFHNWPDKYCIKILRALIPVLKPGAKIVINDQVMPEPCTLPWPEEARVRSNDLNMLELQNAGDREMGEWEKLFLEADGRYAFKGGFKPDGSAIWILEAEWTG